MSPVPPLAQQVGQWSWTFAAEIFPQLLNGLVRLIQATLLGIVVALVLGLVLAILRRSKVRAIQMPVAGLIEFIRSTPLLVQLFFIFFALPEIGIILEPLTAGVVGLGLHYAAYTSESYRAGIESVPRGQWEASIAVNLTMPQTWQRVILPQAIPTVIPALGNYGVAMLKDAPLLAFITYRELLGNANAIRSETFRGIEPYAIAGLLFLTASLVAATFARYLERRFGYERE